VALAARPTVFFRVAREARLPRAKSAPFFQWAALRDPRETSAVIDSKEPHMFRRSIATLLVFFVIASTLLAADKTVKGTLVKVDVKKKVLVLKTDDGKKVYSVDDKTKFIGPKGGVSDAGIKDDRLKPGAALELLVAGNNRTVREVHLPERKAAN
jgi:hypothetical protein